MLLTFITVVFLSIAALTVAIVYRPRFAVTGLMVLMLGAGFMLEVQSRWFDQPSLIADVWVAYVLGAMCLVRIFLMELGTPTQSRVDDRGRSAEQTDDEIWAGSGMPYLPPGRGLVEREALGAVASVGFFGAFAWYVYSCCIVISHGIENVRTECYLALAFTTLTAALLAAFILRTVVSVSLRSNTSKKAI